MSESDWREFSAMIAEPTREPCPFCGIRHQWSNAHPYCSSVVLFDGWMAAGKPAKLPAKPRIKRVAGAAPAGATLPAAKPPPPEPSPVMRELRSIRQDLAQLNQGLWRIASLLERERRP